MIKRENLKKLCREEIHVLSNQGKYRQSLIYIGGLLILVVLLLMPLMFHHSKSRSEKQSWHQENYRQALEANLARLQQYQKHPMKEPIIKKRVNHHLQHLSKTEQVRQHAPTRMYNVKKMDTLNTNQFRSTTLLDQSKYANFVNQTNRVSVIKAERIAHPQFTIPQGELIHATLETAIDSDLPGMIRAVIVEPVYSYLGDHLLIPQGSRLIGQYSSQTLPGTNRIMVLWQRILLPNGISIVIDSPGTDALGRSGFSADQINRHFFQRFGESSLLSLLGAAASNLYIDDTDNENASQQYRAAISQSFQSSANQMLHHMISIKPTLKIHQGSQVLVFVAKDLDFYTVLKQKFSG